MHFGRSLLQEMFGGAGSVLQGRTDTAAAILEVCIHLEIHGRVNIFFSVTNHDGQRRVLLQVVKDLLEG